MSNHNVFVCALAFLVTCAGGALYAADKEALRVSNPSATAPTAKAAEDGVIARFVIRNAQKAQKNTALHTSNAGPADAGKGYGSDYGYQIGSNTRSIYNLHKRPMYKGASRRYTGRSDFTPEEVKKIGVEVVFPKRDGGGGFYRWR